MSTIDIVPGTADIRQGNRSPVPRRLDGVFVGRFRLPMARMAQTARHILLARQVGVSQARGVFEQRSTRFDAKSFSKLSKWKFANSVVRLFFLVTIIRSSQGSALVGSHEWRQDFRRRRDPRMMAGC